MLLNICAIAKTAISNKNINMAKSFFADISSIYVILGYILDAFRDMAISVLFLIKIPTNIPNEYILAK